MRKPQWVKDIDAGCALVDLAFTYTADGAFLTAADRLRQAADLIQKGGEGRMAALDRAAKK